ncbi:MAG: GNAT family N-acetyltransferase [Lachnospiraceae bacterium]|nr:GNAT family N-acetyltransferase [Lachnospiraceae bacterium]
MDAKAMMEQYRDESAGICLRPITDLDTPLIVKWRNNEAVRSKFIYREKFTEEGHTHWLRSYVDTGKAIQMIVCELEGGRPLGSVFFRDVDRVHSKAEYGIFLGEDDARGRGIGTAAAKLMLRYAFEEAGFHRVYLRVLADNVPAIRSYEKAGFVKEAYLRDSVYVEEQYRDVILMAVLEEEWREENKVG